MKQTHGDYSEIEFVRSESAPGKENHENVKSVRRNRREWEETVQKVAETFNIGGSKFDPSTDPGGRNNSAEAKNAGARAYQAIPIGKLTSLREDDTRYYTVAVVGKANDQLKLVTVSWLKEPLHSWLAKAETQVPVTIVAVGANYTLPVISGYSDNSVPSVACTDAWIPTNLTNVPDPRTFPTAVWTGSEMIVWGGYPQLNTGGKYDPSTDSWTATSTVNAPAGREVHTAVWSGSEMIVWGGDNGSGVYFNTGGRYNPGTDSWTATSIVNVPDRRDGHTAVWTGSEMIVWGGYNDDFLNSGGRYNPSTDSWTATSAISAPDSRRYHTAVWTGSEMIV